MDGSGVGDYPTIDAAILGAKTGEIIVLRPGTYTFKVNFTIDRDVRIVGEGGREKVIVERALGTHVFHFTRGSATLTGLTIRYTGPPPPEGSTGAVLVAGGTPMFEDCEFTSSAGAAVYIKGASSNPLLRNCTLRDSYRSGVLVFEQGQGKIERCVISGNTQAGVAIQTGGNPTVRDCQIRDNKQSGVFVGDQGTGVIERCVISGNAINAWRINRTAGIVVRTDNKPNQ
ncbi:MAG: right-handed parallel beta-helix repeat-containing protein [Chloroflexi bacterium]|nr:right-handed parallel beta-helix repeat-containing protein [Chloroflexota bacterium]